MSGHSHGGHSHGGGCDHDHDHSGGGAAAAAAAAADAPPPPSAAAVARSADVLAAATVVLREADAAAASTDSLAVQFLRAEALYHHVVESAPLEGEYAAECGALAAAGGGGAAAAGGCAHPAAHLPAAVAAFDRCAEAVRREGVFSSNESVADVATTDLGYVLIEYYQARLRQQTPPDSGRLRELLRAKFGLETFLAQVTALGIVTREEAAASGIDAYVAASKRGDDDDAAAEEARERDAAAVAEAAGSSASGGSGGRAAALRGGASGGGAGGGAGGGGAGGGARRAGEFGVAAGRAGVDPSVTRALRVARFKRNQETKKRLQELALMTARRVRLSKLVGAEAASDAAELDGVGVTGAADDDVRRETLLLTAVTCARSAVDELQSIAQELPLLMHREAVARATAGGAGGGAAGAAADPRVKPTGPPPGDPSIDPARKGLEVTRIDPTFAVTREVIKADVFTERFKPPSMTMEEWGDIVTTRRLEREVRETAQNATRVRTLEELVEAGEEDKEALLDAATERKRRFDDWADGVPKGAGVTKRV